MSSSDKKVYMDNAAATPISSDVIKEMASAYKVYGNPSSFNDAGRQARACIDKARKQVANFVGIQEGGVVFTSSGSEANNLALFGVTGMVEKPGQIISSPIEHPSILEPLNELRKRGWRIVFLKVDRFGFIDLDDLKEKLNSEVCLVSIMYANNEIGTIQPINQIAKIIKNFKGDNSFPLFHTDACQAAGYLDMNINRLGVDLMTFNGTKIYGPKGIGVLARKKDVQLRPHIFGGEQENGIRAGTENCPAIAGLAKAVSLVNKKERIEMSKLRDYFIAGLIKEKDIKLNGPVGDRRLANNINISVSEIDSDSLLIELDRYGIYASSGSACKTHSVEPSYVLEAIKTEHNFLDGALRFSLGRNTKKKDIDYTLKVLPDVVKRLKKRYRK